MPSPTSTSRLLGPGFPHVFWWILSHLTPAAAVVAAARVLYSYNVVHIPTFLVALTSVLSIPLLRVVRVVYGRWSIKRRAARMGAVLPPSWDGEKFGNMDLVKIGMEGWRKGYPGASLGSGPSVKTLNCACTHVLPYRGWILEQPDG